MKNLDLILDLLAYEGSATNDPKDATKVFNKTQETEIKGLVRYDYQIGDGTSDQAVVVPNPTDYLVILSDREISIKLNGWTTSLTLKPRANGKKTWVYFTKGSVTGLSVSNSSGAIANVDIIVANK
jgi:hypothetical protein